MEKTYPTFMKMSSSSYISEEQLEGVPDYILERKGGVWYGKLRTSAKWETFGDLPVAEVIQEIQTRLA